MSRRQRIAAGLRTARARFRALDRRDRVSLYAFLAVVVFLGTFRVGADERMHASDVMIPGTKSAEARELTERAFGGTENQLMVLLKGPPAALDREGPQIAERIGQLRGYRVLDPWGAGGSALRHDPNTAQLLIGIEKPFDSVSRHDSKQLRALLDEIVEPPMRAHLSGFAEINRAISDESVKAVLRGEVVAAPILLGLLLWIFGTPIAAAMPLFLGGSAALAGAGVLDLLNRFVLPLEVTSITLGTVSALAVGVDYSLLLVARYRSELAAGASVREASEIALARAGRTVKFAAGILCVALVTALAVTPASVLKSATIGILVAVALSVVGAMVALPVLLRWAEHDINRWQIVSPGAESPRWGRLAQRALRRPVLSSAIVLVVIVILALPIMSLETGPPDPRILPKDSVARTDFETVVRNLGGGQSMPFVVTVVAHRGTLADERLKELARFERELRRDPKTAQVLGPATIARRAAELADVPRGLRRASTATRRGERGARRLENGLARASRGVEQLVGGLSEAARGSEQLHDAHGDVEQGSGQVDSGAETARGGAAELNGGMARALDGLETFRDGSRRASAGVERIARGLEVAERRLRAAGPGATDLVDTLTDTEDNLRRQLERATGASQGTAGALGALEGMSSSAKADPLYRAAHEELTAAVATLSGLPPALERGAAEAARGAGTARALRTDVESLRSRLGRLSTSSTGLEDRVRRMATGNDTFGRQAQRLLAEAQGLEGSLARASAETDAIADGVRGLSSGSGNLASTLDSEANRAAPLADGLDSARNGARQLEQRTAELAGGFGKTRRLIPSLDSGYATIAAIERAPRTQRAAAAWAINYNHGGTAVRFLVAPKSALPTRADDPYRPHLERQVAKLERRLDATVVVGGPPTQLADFDQAAQDAMPVLVLMLVLVAYISLVPMMRSLILPLIAVVLNVLTLLASFGVMALAFGANPLLGGAGFVDDIMWIVVFTITFSLSLDYSIFILDRMREGYDLTGTVDGAIKHGIEGTAGVLTGAAAIMTGAFIAFTAVSPVVTLRQVGLGLGVAVILDATLLRLVLLPAAVKLAGDRAWRAPRWLETVSRPFSRPPREPLAEQPEASQA